jgi:small subunit ribosomal protein S6
MPTLSETRVYEAMFLVDPSVASNWDDLRKHLGDVLERHGATIVGITRWDERRLAYTVEKAKRGTYVLSFFGLENGGAVADIERELQLSDQALRVLITRADHFTVADMRTQLGSDVVEDVASRLESERTIDLKAAAKAAEAAAEAKAAEAKAAQTSESASA